jgi:hypothetical protein
MIHFHLKAKVQKQVSVEQATGWQLAGGLGSPSEKLSLRPSSHHEP